MDNKWLKLFPDATLNQVDYLIDGFETFESYVKAIESAKNTDHYIYILGWMIDVDFPLAGFPNPLRKLGLKRDLKGEQTLLKLLKTATNLGVEVRALIWHNPLYLKTIQEGVEAMNKLRNTKAFIDDYTFAPADAKYIIGLIESDVKDLIRRFGKYLVTPYALSKFREQEIDPGMLLYLVSYYLATKNVGAHHEKILIVKGTEGLIAYCGGIDINQNRLRYYHDTACRVTGPEAYSILQHFIKRWYNHGVAKAHTLKGTNEPKPKPELVRPLVRAKMINTYNSPDGKEKNRSVKEAYIKIIAQARSYIYIEDQYMVNLDVAKALNKKLREPYFKQLIIAIQDSRETQDIMIPDRKRGEFLKVLLENTSDEKSKFALLMLNDDRARDFKLHPGLHSKTLIVDDELAIIGSPNINQRSFTLDSETALVIFNNEVENHRATFAYNFRQALWKDLRGGRATLYKFPDIGWEEFVFNTQLSDNYSLFRKHYVNNIQDWDIRLIDKIKQMSVPIAIGIGLLYKDDLAKALHRVSVLNPVTIPLIFDSVFHNIIDPEVK
jgi:phosphatidylserine/phosphatidylglycerophosphate/cardiolipin synthase-like enzyme